MSYYLAPALDVLRDEINAAYPNRSKASDGWIGDRAHRNRKSDHNPNSRGSVNALDVTAKGIDTAKLIEAAKKHPSVQYVIHDRRIMNRDIGNFRSRAYTGPNPHTTHVHISIRQNRAAEQDRRSWGIGKAAASKPAPAKKPKPGIAAPRFPLKPGHWFGTERRDPRNHSGYWREDRPHIHRIQSRLRTRGWRIEADGRFGPATARVIRQFQKEKGLRVDGGVGVKTWRALWEAPIT